MGGSRSDVQADVDEGPREGRTQSAKEQPARKSTCQSQFSHLRQRGPWTDPEPWLPLYYGRTVISGWPLHNPTPTAPATHRYIFSLENGYERFFILLLLCSGTRGFRGALSLCRILLNVFAMLPCDLISYICKGKATSERRSRPHLTPRGAGLAARAARGSDPP